MRLMDTLDYKEYIRAQIEAHRSERGYHSRLAEKAGCQRSYLSQVLKGHQHLTLDQGCGLASFWRLSQIESDYFLDLISYAKAGTPALRERFATRLTRLRDQAQDLAKRLRDRDALDSAAQQRYYSAWYWGAIHVILSIPGLDQVDRIAAHLGLTSTLVEKVLHGLQDMGLAHYENHRWLGNPGNLHLSRDSPLIRMHHNNWRQRAMNEIPAEHLRFQFSAVLTHSREDFKTLQDMILDFLDRASAVVEKSPAEQMSCLNIDFLPLGPDE